MTSDDGYLIAAVDLGSNSFHLVIGRVQGEWISIIDRLRDPVRLAAGLDGKGHVKAERVDVMVASLKRFRQRLRGVSHGNVRAIGTNTFRQVGSSERLLERAEEALGLPIEVLPGPEEARLIYLGVCHEQPRNEDERLVIDIGGGSTECILGRGYVPIYTDSLHMGCVSFSRQFFGEGTTRDAFRRAEIAAKLEFETIQERFRKIGWTECLGSSGTINAVAEILSQLEGGPRKIDRPGIKRLRKAMVTAGTTEALDLPGLARERAAVLPGGLAVLKAAFDMLGIESMTPTKAALREGVLYDLLGRLGPEDVRDRTIRELCGRYQVDAAQAQRVEASVREGLEQVAAAWDIADPDVVRLLVWASSVHEIGLAITYTGHHKHGAYVIAHSSMPGFSREEQERLAALVRGHRRKFRREHFAGLRPPWRKRVRRASVILRVAVRLNRTRGATELPPIEWRLAEGRSTLTLGFPARWLARHPLTRADLEEEAQLLGQAGLDLVLEERAEPEEREEPDSSRPREERERREQA